MIKLYCIFESRLRNGYCMCLEDVKIVTIFSNDSILLKGNLFLSSASLYGEVRVIWRQHSTQP
jgi:hypothetical protein